MGKVITAVATVMALVVALALVAAIAAGTTSAGSGGATAASGSTGGPDGGGATSSPAVPDDWQSLYQRAAATCPGLPWSVLAAVGTVESGSGQSDAPGVRSGANSAGAEGPMQFEPATFHAYATVGPDGARPPSPYDPVDAVYTASALLCADGAGSPSSLRAAITDYNHSVPYVDTVLTLSLALAAAPSLSGTIVTALTFAAEQLGTPYVWGGTGNGGFDCSGLVQASYRAAGVTLPRVAQSQYDAGPPVPVDATVLPGDLVFFGSGPSGVEHVGLYVGGGEMIDAPHTGALVRLDGAAQSDLVGATRPG
ncbi:MAG: NlpC/P60 family protein [Acidimicrobiales bacterium]